MTYQPYLPATDMERFVRELAEFVTFGDADAALVRETAPMVLARGDALTAALYEHFLKFPASARFFLKDDGTPDPERIERRRHSLARWLRETAEAALTHEHAYYLLTIGLSHSHRPRGPGRAGSPPLATPRQRAAGSCVLGSHPEMGTSSRVRSLRARFAARDRGQPSTAPSWASVASRT